MMERTVVCHLYFRIYHLPALMGLIRQLYKGQSVLTYSYHTSLSYKMRVGDWFSDHREAAV